MGLVKVTLLLIKKHGQVRVYGLVGMLDLWSHWFRMITKALQILNWLSILMSLQGQQMSHPHENIMVVAFQYLD